MTPTTRRVLPTSVPLAIGLFLTVSAPVMAADDAKPAPPAGPATRPAVVRAEFVYDLSRAPTPSCHASTIAETKDGLAAAWFGGLREGATDVGIWLARHDGTRWSDPVEVATGDDPATGKRLPCWNPVLF